MLRVNDRMSGWRILFAAPPAALVTFALLLFMHQLVSSGRGERAAPGAIAGIHFGPVQIADEMVTKNRYQPPEPPPPRDPPPPPRLQLSRVQQPVQNMPRMDLPELELPPTGGAGLFIGNFQQVDATAEGDIIPLVVIRPLFPHEAAMAGIEGWVKVEFTITPSGTVTDARVVAAEPARIFNREAIRAISKWKFKPRVVDGVAVPRRATQLIDFSLDTAGGA